MPGLVLYELLRKRFDRVVLITVVFGGCLIFETLIVDILLREHGVLLGRLEVISHGANVANMRDEFSSLTPVDMFRRWWFIATSNLDRLGYYSKLLYFVFFSQCAWYLGSLVREAGGKTSSPVLKVGAPEQEFVFAVLSLGLSFAVCTTFFVISLHPFTMGEPLFDRYLWVLLVPAMLLLTQLLDGRVARICERLAAILTGNGSAHRARSWLAQHSIELSIVAIVVLGTFSRLLIEGELVSVRPKTF